MTSSSATLWLRVEGLFAFLVSVLFYMEYGSGWLLFAILLMVPDLSMVGYLRGPRFGAVLYNVVHSYTTPILLAIASVPLGSQTALTVALIWTAHIGFDRMLGYGLKLPTGFRDTHLGRIGQRTDRNAAR